MSATPTPARNLNKGKHYTFIKNALSDPFKTATVDRAYTLTATKLKIEPWYTAAPALHHDKLKSANLKAWSSQNQVDELFEKLQDIHAFAAPLLQAKLMEKYGVADDVNTSHLRLYLPANMPWYAINVTGGSTTRTVSLLDAALHNFAKTETVDADSQYITRPDHRGHFDVLPLKDKMTISQFQALCRELDIGALYRAHLECFLLPGEPVAEAVMKLKVTTSQKDALAVAAQLALTTGDVQYDACKLMLDLTKDAPQLLLNGRHMRCCDLSMMETRLTGITLVIPAIKDSKGIVRLIAYVPHDPDHPLKEYESPNAFMKELSHQLRENKVGASSGLSYRQFFSQFVDQQQRGHFFADLDQRLSTIKWHEKEGATDQRPTWREEAVPRPHLQFEALPLSGDFWTHTYQQKLNKVLNDAREIAVSTADTDSKARWAWWDNFKKIVSDIFNVALLIATPFVPGVGELMMAYTVYQMTSDVIEGLVDLAEGLGLEAAEHVVSVVTDVIQLAAFGAGAELGNAFKLKLSSLVDGMKPVKLPNGQPTLWHPDLEPYAQKDLVLPNDSKPDGQGLHQHANGNILPLEGKIYFVEKASTEPTSNTHRVKHPTRPNAYSPKLQHNGQGTWLHEGENPGAWRGETLMRRLGHSVERFSPIEREQIRISSGTDHDVLRRMYVENTAPAPLLADTIKRFSAYDEVKGGNGETAEDLYQAGEQSSNAHVGLLRQTFPHLPLTLTETILANAKPAELQRMTDEHRLPLRIKSLARELNFEADAARAYEGFYRDEMTEPATEQLTLNTLKFNSDSFGDLRIEVRDGSQDGTLRCSAGPDDASTVRRLIRNEQGQYEVRDGSNATLHDAGDFYESILRALPDNQRVALGYQRGQGRPFKQWIMEKSAAPADRRTVMAAPPIRPAASVETEKLVRGWPWFFGEKNPEQRIRQLYPELGELETASFIEALRNPAEDLTRLENELDDLRTALNSWEEAQQLFVDSDVGGSTHHLRDFMRNGGGFIKERLLYCFERRGVAYERPGHHPEGGYTLNLSSDVRGPHLDRWWNSLRELPNINTYLEQVTVLTMDNARFSPDARGLLRDFPNLRSLRILNSELTEIPPSIANMHALQSLSLTDCNIRLSTEAATPWKGLNNLETLRLDGNPLGRSPDVSGLPRLKVLRLADTRINEWPSGIFTDATGNNRPRNFYLDMRDCPINTLPEVSDADHVFIVANTRFNYAGLSEADKVRLGDYREATGFSRKQIYSPAAAEELHHWPLPADDSSLFSRSVRYTMDTSQHWHDLEVEPGSTGFFKVIRKLRQTADYHQLESRKQLTNRVWQMIEAAALDSELREELFKQSRQPETCADAGSQLFNRMGMKVLVSQAYRESASAAVLEDKLVRLARSDARLAFVDDVARAEISSQQQKHLINPAGNLAPDDVEVHLAYETGLAKRLDLPWRSEAMLYAKRSGVDEVKINTAYELISQRESGDGLVNGMVDSFEHPFWEQYLRKTHPQQFEENDRLFSTKSNQLEELRETQKTWVNNQDAAQLNALQKKLEALARVLNVSEMDVFSGEEMTTPTYNRLVQDLGYARNGLARALTREAMARAGL